MLQHTTTTVNADQAVVNTGNPAHVQENTGRGAMDPALLTAATDKPMQMIDGTVEPEALQNNASAPAEVRCRGFHAEECPLQVSRVDSTVSATWQF